MSRAVLAGAGCLVAIIVAVPLAIILAGGAVIAGLIPSGIAVVHAPLVSAQVPEVGHIVVVAVAPLPGVPAGGYPDAFPAGQCTYWAAFNHRVTWSGNATDWFANAARQGALESRVPSPGEIVVYHAGGHYSVYGHVGIVVAVAPGQYTISEMNYEGLGVVDLRTMAWPDGGVEGFVV